MRGTHKYGAKQTIVDGIKFASKREAARYQELRLMVRAGVITNLVLQPRYLITVKGQKICTYVADFGYLELPACNVGVVEDVKGVKTPVYKLKKRLMKAVYGIEIREIQ